MTSLRVLYQDRGALLNSQEHGVSFSIYALHSYSTSRIRVGTACVPHCSVVLVELIPLCGLTLGKLLGKFGFAVLEFVD